MQRNRTRGRPGSKGGRGRGGGSKQDNTTTANTKISTSNKTNNSSSLGSNAFRYEKKQSLSSSSLNDSGSDHDLKEKGNRATGHDHDQMNIGESSLDYLTSGNEHGPSHYSVASNFYNNDDLFNRNAVSAEAEASVAIDVKLLSKCLENDNQLNYLRLDGRMRDIFQKRFHSGSSSEMKMTVAEMRALPVLGDEDTGSVGGGEEKTDDNLGSGDNGDNDEVENLEAWLDDMIM